MNFFLILISALLINSCRTITPTSKTHSTPDQPATKQNLPPIGRSLFDHIFLGGANKITQFPKLLEYLKENHQINFSGVLIPSGRSLVKNTTTLEHPRVVVTGAAKFSSGQCPKNNVNTLFLGYSEKTASLEVISYNEQSGRYEFQIVKDFAPQKKPKLFYANRSLCTSCHQDGVAIFSSASWSETNNGEGLRGVPSQYPKKIAQHHHGKEFYQGLVINPNKPADPLTLPPLGDNLVAINARDIENQARLTSQYMLLSRLYSTACGQDKERQKCLSLVLKFALYSAFADHEYFKNRKNKFGALAIDPKSAEVEFVTTVWKKYWPLEGIGITNPILEDRLPNDPLTVATNPLSPRGNLPNLSMFMLSERDYLPHVDSPIAANIPSLKGPTPNQFITLLRDLWITPYRDPILKAIGDDFTKIDSINQSQVLKNFIASKISPSTKMINAILESFGGKSISTDCYEPSTKLPPAAAINGSNELVLDESSPDHIAGLFHQFCSECHVNTGVDTLNLFKNLSPQEITAGLHRNRKKILSRLDLDQSELDEDDQMPPTTSQQHEDIQKSAARFKMIHFLRSLGEHHP